MNDLVVTEKKLKWFHYNQNNSGGYFIQNDVVAEDVFVQAFSAAEASAIVSPALEEYSQYCECCGERWYYWQDDEDGTDEPEKYGESIFNSYKTFGSDGYAILYWHNGLVDKFEQHKGEVK